METMQKVGHVEVNGKEFSVMEDGKGFFIQLDSLKSMKDWDEDGVFATRYFNEMESLEDWAREGCLLTWENEARDK